METAAGYAVTTTTHTSTVRSIEPGIQPPNWEILVYMANSDGQSELVRARVKDPTLGEILRAVDIEREKLGGLPGYVTQDVFQFSRFPLASKAEGLGLEQTALV